MTAIRVASYNLLHGLHLARGGVVDLAAAAEAVADLEADVVALQEVDRGLPRSGGVDQAAELADRLGMAGVFCPALLGDPGASWTTVTAGDDGGAGYGVGLLSRLPVGTHRRIALPGGGAGTRRPGATPSRPGWDHEPRAALAAELTAPAGAVAVTVIHLSYMPWRAVHQLRVAAGVGSGARVLVGDMNLAAAVVRAVLPAWDHAGGGPTYPAWRPRVQLDHLLVDGGVAVREAGTAQRTTGDHLPLVADLSLPGLAAPG